MGVRFKGEANDIIGNTWTVEIHDTSYILIADEIQLGGGIFQHEFDGYEQLFFTPMQPSRVVIPIVIRPVVDADFEAFVNTDLVQATENRYHIVIKKGSTRYFVGNLLVDMIQYDDNTTYIIELTATDGLKRLEKYYFDYVTTIASGGGQYINDLTALTKCLEKTGFDQFFTNTETYIESVVNWFEVDADHTQGTLLETRTQIEMFYEDVEKKTPKKCADVIELILKKYGASIKFANGRWVVSQFSNHAQENTVSYLYTKLTTFNTTGFIGTDRTLTNNNKSRDRLINTFMPALNRVEINQKGESGLMLTKNWTGLGTQTSVNHSRTVTNLSGESLQINFEWRVADSIPSGGQRDRIELKFNINEGTYYLKYNKATGETTWTTNSSDRFFYNLPLPNNNIGILVLKGSFTTPPLPGAATGTTLTVNMSGDSYYYNPITLRIPSTQAINFDIFGFVKVSQYFDAPNSGAGITGEQTTTAAITTLLENSEVIEEEIDIYEQTPNVEFVKQWPQIDNGTAWVNSSEWARDIVSSSGIPLAELLAREAIYHQRKPVRLIQGGFRLDEFYTYDTLVWRSRRFVFLKGTFNAKMCEWDGEWVQYVRDATGSTVGNDAPIRIRIEYIEDDLETRDFKDGMTDESIRALQLELSQLRNALNGTFNNFMYDDATGMADPGAGKVRFNNTNPANVTRMAISYTNANDVGVKESVYNWLKDDKLYIKSVKDANVWVKYHVFVVAVDNSTWAEFELVYIDHVGSFTDNDIINISVVRGE